MHKLSSIDKKTLFYSFNLKATHRGIASNISLGRTMAFFFLSLRIHHPGVPLLTVNIMFYGFVAFNT